MSTRPKVLCSSDHDGSSDTSEKNQRQCGSCWAFLFVANGNFLSEQQLVDCDMVVLICQGGFMDNDFTRADKNDTRMGGTMTDTLQ